MSVSVTKKLFRLVTIVHLCTVINVPDTIVGVGDIQILPPGVALLQGANEELVFKRAFMSLGLLHIGTGWVIV